MSRALRLAFGALVSLVTVNQCLTAQPAGSRATNRAVVHGIVLDTLQRLVAGARVYLFADSVVPAISEGSVIHFNALVTSRETDAQGRFDFGSLRPRLYSLRTFGGVLEAVLDSVTVGPSDSVTVRLVLNRQIPPRSTEATRSRNLAALARAQSRWASRAVPKYRVTARLDCFCNAASEGPATLEFHNDTLVGKVDRAGRLTRDPALPWWKAFSVPSLFAAAEAEIRDPRRVVFSIVYDSTYGLPKLISTDTNQHMTDLWLRYWVDSFRVVRR